VKITLTGEQPHVTCMFGRSQAPTSHSFAFFGLGSLAFGGSLSATQTPTTEPTDQEIQMHLARLDLRAKVGQMIQAEILNVKEAMDKGQHPIRDLGLGSVLAGGNSIIADSSPAGWRKFLGDMQAEAAASSARFPLLTGVDAVHGHAIVKGATVFPHNIGLGATQNPELMRAMGEVVAKEVLATGFNWNFAPAVSVARDPRWGRTYESFGYDPQLQNILTAPTIEGMQETPSSGIHMSATAKHFLADGGTAWGTGFPIGTTGLAGIDRGNSVGDLQRLMAIHGQGYLQAINADVHTIMISYNLVNGTRMHANDQLVERFLKAPKEQGGLGFRGLVVSDWNAIEEIPFAAIPDTLERYKAQVIKSVQAGVDMLMVEGKLDLPTGRDNLFRYERAYQTILQAVRDGVISEQRINDAVTRILTVKLKSGLKPGIPTHTEAREVLGIREHREIARQAVRESLVLLKNNNATLPIRAEKYRALCVAGSKADDFGVQAGAWTTGWQGTLGNASKSAGSKTILEGLRSAASQRGIPVFFAANGIFTNGECNSPDGLRLVVAGENPYAEYFGDSNNLVLPAEDTKVLANTRGSASPTAIVLISGRPVIISRDIQDWDALVAAWLPGSQGEGVADVLFGDFNFKGKLSQPWPASMSQVPFKDGDQLLFPLGHGLRY
jgi:beta-glucosidase